MQGRASNGIFAGAEERDGRNYHPARHHDYRQRHEPGGKHSDPDCDGGNECRIRSGAAAQGSAITVNAASTINTFGVVTPNASIFGNPVGIRALSKADADAAPIFVNYTGPGITTAGGGGIGILALARTAAAPASTAAASR